MMRRQVLTGTACLFSSPVLKIMNSGLACQYTGRRLGEVGKTPSILNVSQFNSRDSENLKLFIYQHIREAVPNLSIGKDSIDLLVDVRSSGLRGALRVSAKSRLFTIVGLFAKAHKNDLLLESKKLSFRMSYIIQFSLSRWQVGDL
jgi:hypothetical protein